jgi:hypothetical protein
MGPLATSECLNYILAAEMLPQVSKPDRTWILGCIIRVCRWMDRERLVVTKSIDCMFG